MATIKSYTDIPQSETLRKILPLESADNHYWCNGYNNYICGLGNSVELKEKFEEKGLKYLPCWSPTALLSVLPNEIITDNRFECHYQISIRKYNGGDNTTLYQIAYGNNRGSSGSWHDMINTGEKDNLVDACYEMILELNKLNLL